MLLFAGIWLHVAAVRAQSPQVWVVVSGREPLVRALRAEASENGLDLEMAPSDAIDEADPVLLDRLGGVAVVRLLPRGGATIFVCPIANHAAYFRTLEGASNPDSVLALRVVEQIRARLVELELVSRGDPARPGSVAVSQKAPATGVRRTTGTEPRPETAGAVPTTTIDGVAARPSDAEPALLWLSAGLAGTAPAGAWGGALQAALGLRVEPSPRAHVEALALLPITENNLTASEGTADAEATLLLGRLSYAVIGPTPGFMLDVGGGGGVLILTMAGETNPPRSGREARVFAALGTLSAGASFRATPWLRMRMTVLGGIAAPRPVARFSGREVAAWGRPFAGLTLLADFGLTLSNPEVR